MVRTSTTKSEKSLEGEQLVEIYKKRGIKIIQLGTFQIKYQSSIFPFVEPDHSTKFHDTWFESSTTKGEKSLGGEQLIEIYEKRGIKIIQLGTFQISIFNIFFR